MTRNFLYYCNYKLFGGDKMDLEALKEAGITQAAIDLFYIYAESNVLFGLILPFIDAFIPVLPLWAFITLNVYAFGFIPGFIVSWIGSVLGNICVFLILRKVGKNNITKFLYKTDKNNQVLSWIDKGRFFPMFIYFSLPFTPAFLLVIFAAFTRVSIAKFLLALVTGKFVMIFFIAYVGKDFRAILENPIKGVFYALVLLFVWYIGRKFEVRMARGLGEHVIKDEKVTE